MTYAARRAAEQMRRDGITSLPRWSKGVRVGCAIMRRPLAMPHCEELGCPKKAGYSTPRGNRCFTHAMPGASK